MRALMHTMEHINVDYLERSRLGRVPLSKLAEMMQCAAFGTMRYECYMAFLQREAKRLGSPVEKIREVVDESVYDIEL